MMEFIRFFKKTLCVTVTLCAWGIVGILGLFIIMIAGIGIHDYIKYPTHPYSSKFYSRLKEIKIKNPATVYFTDITPFEWEKLCFIAPYGRIESEFGNDYISVPLLSDDGIFHIAFGLPDKQVVPIRVSREFFEANRQAHCLSYEQAKYVPLNLLER